MSLSKIILFLLIPTTCLCQDFELKYACHGLGSNHGRPPSNRIYLKNQDLKYTYQVNTDSINFIDRGDTIYWKKDTSEIIQINQKDLDSISFLFKGLENKQISYSNMCVKSGACYEMEIKTDTSCTRIIMFNNYDSTVYKVAQIINRYLPKELKIYIPESTWETARKCSRPGLNLTEGRRRNYDCLKWDD